MEVRETTHAHDRAKQREDRIVGRVLRIGAYTAITLVVAGMAASPLHSAVGALLLKAGLVVLMFTPISRVAVACLVFAQEGDRRYAVVSAGVLVILVVSSVLAFLKVVPEGGH